MRGKEKCKILKQIRKQIADENDIPYVVEECKHKGECRGTCPKCEAELRQLERELSLRHRIGKTVAIAGLAAGMLTMTTGCTLEDVAAAAAWLLRGKGRFCVMLPAPRLTTQTSSQASILAIIIFIVSFLRIPSPTALSISTSNLVW